MARIAHLDRNAPLDWGSVAVVRRDLQSVIDAHEVTTEWLLEPEEGGWLREVQLVLDTGGLAYLDEQRHYPGEFTVNLLRHRDMFFFKEDLQEVLAFLKVDDADVTVLTGQVRWWKKGRPPKQPRESRGQSRPSRATNGDA